MHPFSVANRRPRIALRLVLTCIAVSFAALTGVAAPPTGENIHWTKAKSFRIPFTPEQGSTGIQRVTLYYSDDEGRTPYKVYANAGPNPGYFDFTARSDGWYWFSVQTQDVSGKLYPSNVNLSPPGLKICVDTLPPAVYVKQIPTTEAAAAFEWNIREDNPNLYTLRADYRTVGNQDWIKLELPPRLAGQIGFNPTVKGPWEVRVQLTDKAGNLGEQTTTVTPGSTFHPEAAPTQPTPPRSNFKRVNSRSFQINYRIDLKGKSDVSVVEIWKTEDDGRTWKPDIKNASTNGPCRVDVNRDGIFGFFVVPVSGVGLSDPPSPGMPPQVSIEVDTIPPVVTLLGAPLIGTGQDLNKVTIRYHATDKNFGPNPIRILWRDAKVQGSEWQEAGVNLPNDGVFVWSVPESVPAHSFMIKIEAVDLAGNVGMVQTGPVNVDPIKPRASVIDVEAVKGVSPQPVPPQPVPPQPMPPQ